MLLDVRPITHDNRAHDVNCVMNTYAAKAGTQVVVPYRDEDEKRHLKVMGDLGQIVPLVCSVVLLTSCHLSSFKSFMLFHPEDRVTILAPY